MSLLSENRLVKAYRKYSQYRATYNELAQLSPRELADLNVGHYDVQAIAYNAVYK